MDESTGLLTILCQHVFHCSCLQKWRGSGCPVCRYTQDAPFVAKRHDPDSLPNGVADLPPSNECSVCHSEQNLWICLICGNVGCGRYDAAHAFQHYEASGHCFSMDMGSQRVWDYGSDGYVHRIVQNKADGKVVQLDPASIVYEPDDDDDYRSRDGEKKASGRSVPHDYGEDYEEYVSRGKLTNLGLEYTHLLTSQLDSQRAYFEQLLDSAADKASLAATSAAKASDLTTSTQKELESLRLEYKTLIQRTIPTLERDLERSNRRAEKFETMARKLEKEWREEKALGGSLMERVEHLNKENTKLKAETVDLEEQNRDLSFFITGQQKLSEMKKGEIVEEEELMEGTVEVGAVNESEGKGKKKRGKGGGKK